MSGRRRGACRASVPSAVAVCAIVVAGCSVINTGSTPAGTSTAAETSVAHVGLTSLAPPRLAHGGWTALGSVRSGTPVTYVVRVDHGRIALLWMNPALLRFRFVPGTQIPESSPARPTDNLPATWLSRMAAAFNGGFWLKDLHPGGYFYDGKVVKPLVAGQAALVVTSSGHLSVGMWGRDLRLGAGVLAVRENLPLLVDGFRDRAGTITGPHAWGRSTNEPVQANRSALGELADGSIVYEYGHKVTPEEMAAAMVDIRARTAMMLDMNGSWPGAFVYWRAGVRLQGKRIHPSIYHDPSLYYVRYKKDFIVALLG